MTTSATPIAAVAAQGPHVVTIASFLDDLPAVVREHDLVISAAGTSVWDFACMGAPMALVCAVDNQARAYRTVIDAGLAHPLGQPPLEALTDNVAQLGCAARRPRCPERASCAAAAR